MRTFLENKLAAAVFPLFALAFACSIAQGVDPVVPGRLLTDADLMLLAHGPSMPPDPWEKSRVAHGPSMPPEPWEK
jgi:hypothetical protein